MSTDGTPARVAPPVLLLGSHRAGTSAVTGLLAEAGGLELGDVLPPTSANAKGYYESAAIVRGHNIVLAALDRDWTCPPVDLDPASVPTESIRAEVATLDATGRPWGLKDPRTLFTLPLWAELLPEVRLVGIIRDHEEVVRSLVSRDRLDGGVADAITRAHFRRLRVLADRLGLPVIDFSAPPVDVIARTAEIAGALGLGWDEDAAATFFDAGLARSRSRGMVDNPDIDHLRTGATSRTEVPTVTAAELRAVLDELAKEPDELDRYCGPRSAARRRRVWGAVPKDLQPVLEFPRTLDVAASLNPVRPGGRAVACRDLLGLYQQLRALDRSVEGVVLPDVTSWLRAEELGPALRLVHDHVAPDAVVAVGLSAADADVQRLLGREPVTARQVADAGLAAGFAVLSQDGDELMTIVRLVALSTTRSVLRDALEHGVLTGGTGRPVRRPAAGKGAGKGAVKADEVATAANASELVAARAAELEWRTRYERLRARRSVRLVLRLTELARPLFRVVRRTRRSLGR